MSVARYQPSAEVIGELIRRHPWWRWLTRTPFSAKMTKYALGSAFAFGLSDLVFAFCYWLALSTTVGTVIAFISAAIPNWILNRRWAWQQSDRAPLKQTLAYAGVSIVVLVVTALATHLTNSAVQGIPQHHGIRLVIVTGSFVVVNVVLFFAKFAIYEFVIFPGRDGERRARRSRANVNKIARANRIP